MAANRIQYKLLVFVDQRQLNKEVSEHLNDGWILYGNPIVALTARGDLHDDYDGEYAQAVTREIAI